MILSLKHRFVFVRGRKVAGTSVEIALSTLCGAGDIVPPILAVDEQLRQAMGGHCGNYSDDPAGEAAFLVGMRGGKVTEVASPISRYAPHMSLRSIEQAFGRSLDDFTLVCVERDPYAKVISALHMQRNFGDYRDGMRADMATPVEHPAADLDRLIAKDRLGTLRSMSLYGGRTPRVLRYERIEHDLAEFARDLGVDPPPLPHAKRGPMSNTIDPVAIFRRDQIDLINTYFAAEFTAFGYALR